MRVRRSYDVSSPESGTVSSRDNNLVATRHHWILPLTFFFILCGVVLAVSWLSVRTTKSAKNETGGTSESFKSAMTTIENDSKTLESTTTLESRTTKSEGATSEAPTTMRTITTKNEGGTSKAPTTMRTSTTTSEMETLEALTTMQSSTTTNEGGTSKAPTIMRTSTTTSEMETSEAPPTMRTSATTTESATSEAPTTMWTSTTTSEIETSEAPTTIRSSTTTTEGATSEAPTPMWTSTTTSEMETSEAPTKMWTSTTTSEIETSEAPTTIRSSTTTTEGATSEAPTPMWTSTTTSEMETSEASTTIWSSTTTTEGATSEAPTTMRTSTTTTESATSEAPTPMWTSTTTSEMETSEAPTTIWSSTTTTEGATSEAPTTMRTSTTTTESATSEAPTTMRTSTTTTESATSEAPTTMWTNTTISEMETSEAPTTMRTSTTTTESATSEAPTTMQSSTTTNDGGTSEAPTKIWISTTTSEMETSKAPTTIRSTVTTSEIERSEAPTTIASTRTTTGTSETPAEKMCHATREAMNPSARPCEDFYEYACGGFEASNATTGTDPAEEGIRRIFDQARKENTSYSNFLKYFKSCMSYEQDTTREQRMDLALKHIREVGNFSTAGPPDNFDVIPMLSKLLLRDSSPLFDIILDFDTDENLGKQHKLVLKMIPPVFKSTLCVDVSETCYAKQMEAMAENDEYADSMEDDFGYGFEEEDENNKSSKNHLNSKNHSNFVMDAIEKFPEFMKRQDKDEIKSGVEYILEEIYKLREVEPSKVTALPGNEPDDLDFRRLVETSIDSNELKNLEIYSNPDFASVIRDILQSSNNAQKLYNGLLGLYVYKIYNEMVLPGRTEAYCRRAATSLMQQDAVNLYLSSFPTEERERRNNLAKTMFQKLIHTLKLDVQNATWLNVTRVAVENKIDKMSIELPYLPNNDKNAPEIVPVTLTGNFLDDTVMLQGQNRRAMYRMLGESANEHNIWTYFAVPYQTSASVIYNLNKVVVPYGAVDWSGILRTSEKSLEYLRIATLGTVIAHGIGRHFDQTGMRYYDRSMTNSPNEIFYCGKPCEADRVFRTYTYVHKLRGRNQNRIKLSSTGMDVTYTLDDRSLNDRIAEDIGVQLAYRTMQGSSSSSDLLPCLGSENQLKEKQFFLAYAQMHCTKEPLTTSPVLLKDGHSLPGRIRIAQLAANDYQFMIGTWNCRNTSGQDDGSELKIFPSVVIKPLTAFQKPK